MQDLASMGATRMVVGLSQLVRFLPPAYLNGFVLKNITAQAGGTFEIVNPALYGSSSVAATGWGQGYPVAANEVVSAAGPISFYMAASGVTQTVAILFGNSVGASTP